MPRTITQAVNAVEGIIKDLTDRRGLRQEWEGIDEDIQKEIVEAWVNIILECDQA